MAGKIFTTLQGTLAGEVRREIVEGKTYLVNPVVAIIPGVHNRKFYSAETLTDMAAGWNGRPVVVYHPVTPRGTPATANTPVTLARRCIGQLFNVWIDANGRLGGEVWTDEEQAARIAPELLERMRTGDGVEVSTGLFTVEDGHGGTWNGEEYDTSVLSGLPDHLALLPDRRGACSQDDGCGLNRNQEAAMQLTNNNEGWFAGLVKAVQTAMSGKPEPAAGGKTPTVNALSFSDIEDALQQQISALDVNGWRNYVRDTFDGEFVYVAYNDDPNRVGAGPTSVLYRRTFAVDAETATVAIGDTAQEVRRDVNYVPVTQANQESAPASAATEEGTNMNKAAVINAAIACNGSPWVEEDRAFLEGLTEPQLLKVLPKAPALNEDEAGKGKTGTAAPAIPEVPATPAAPADPKAPVTMEDWLSGLPEQVRTVVVNSVRSEAKRRSDLIEKITANAGNPFTEDQLKGMTTEILEGIVRVSTPEQSADPVHNFLAAVGAGPTGNAESRFIDMPKVWDLGGNGKGK